MKIEAIEIASVGIPSKGPLYEGSVSLLEKSSLTYVRSPRQYVSWSLFSEYEAESEILVLVKLAFMRPRDIVKRVSVGDLDLGISGGDIIDEVALPVTRLGELGFAKCKLIVTAPNSFISSASLRIGTSYPRLAKNYFSERNILIAVEEADGATEGMTRMNWADAIVEITETGKTLGANGLSIEEEIQSYQAELIANPALERGSSRFLAALVSRLLKAKDCNEGET